MPPVQYSSPFYQHIENPAVISLLRPSPASEDQKHRRPKKSNFGGGLLRMFKLLPMLSSGCKMVALLGRAHKKGMLKDSATTGTIFGHRKGRVNLAIQEDPHCPPMFIIELPMLTSTLQKEMASDVVRIALESERGNTGSKKKLLLEELVWGVYCNGRKVGYSIRRTQMSEDEIYVMQVLRGVSMGAGVLPNNNNNNNNQKEEWLCSGEMNDQFTYMRARFERVVGSKDSEALYMINPDGATGAELSIFFVRGGK